MIGIDLNKQQALEADPNAIQSTGNLDSEENTAIFFITKEAKETILYFHKKL